jgi:hypothetical protein
LRGSQDDIDRPRSTILALLKLRPDIRAATLALPPGNPERLVTERNIRAFTSAPPKAFTPRR